MRGLLLERSAAPETDPGSDSIVKLAIKRLEEIVTTAKSQYRDIRSMLLTFNIYKRMFSIAGLALTNRRRGILPHNYKIQLFLCMNQNFWEIMNIKKIVHDIGEDPTREAAPDMELADNLTHGRQSQVSAASAPRIQ